MSRGMRWLAAGVGALMTFPVGLGVAHAVTEPDPGGEGTTPVSIPSAHPAAPLPDDFDPSKISPGREPVDEAELARLEERWSTNLSECPEIVEFFQRAEVKKFYDDNFGAVPGPDTDWAGTECPDLGALKDRYAEARSDVRH